MGKNSKNCLLVRLEIESGDVSVIYKTLKPDDEKVEDVNYHSELIGNRIIYVFESCNILKLRNTIDDVLEKAALAEEVIKGASERRVGEHRSVG